MILSGLSSGKWVEIAVRVHFKDEETEVHRG